MTSQNQYRMTNKFQQFTLKKINVQNKYSMTPLELKDYINFAVKRIYYISYPQGVTGSHCHKTEEELFVVMQGLCVAEIDRGNGLEKIPLETGQAIYISNYVWHHFESFSPDCVLLALSSTNYLADRSDYIEDYEDYLKIRDEKLRE